jgi:hypothetical protein
MAGTSQGNVSFQRVLIGGLIASMVMGMWEMLFEQLVGGNGFWASPVYIAATVLRDLQSVSTPVPFAFVPVVLGLMGHMMNSVLLGFIFSKVAPRITSSVARLAVLGVVYSIIIFATMWYVALPLINPVMLQLNSVVFVLAHMMWGAALGIVLGRAADTLPRMREAEASQL